MSRGVTVEAMTVAGIFDAGDAHFSRLCISSGSDCPPDALATRQLLCAATSRALRDGHACLPLSALSGVEIRGQDGTVLGTYPERSEFEAALVGFKAVSRPGEKRTTPLVCDDEGRLYVARYFEHERVVAEHLARLLSPREDEQDLDEHWLKTCLDRYFPEGMSPGPDLQRKAAELALTSRFSIITGGPGTGKTSTVVKILALLGDVAEKRGHVAPYVQLLAPTGKAAFRMMEAVTQALSTLDLPAERKKRLVTGASTIHRALGIHPDNPNRFRRGVLRPLRADVVIVDEASMIDLALMRGLLEALKDGARLVLLGDRHQLASVEAGSVLSELCAELDAHGRTVELLRSYRFAEGSGIFDLAKAVREGDLSVTSHLLEEGRPDATWHGPLGERSAASGEPKDSQRLRALVLEHFGGVLRAPDARTALTRLSDFRILCAHRRGPFGVEVIGALVERWLAEAGLLPRAATRGTEASEMRGVPLYRGRPFLITENDYAMSLFNGDVGILWPNAEGRLVAFVFDETGALRSLSPAQLPAHETAFALTIHKSQGSEYGEVAVVLPEATSQLLSKELVYTAITRAKRKVSIFGTSAALLCATGRSVVRHSGLAAALRQAAVRA